MKGWYKESYRHYLAGKGIKTNRYYKSKYYSLKPVFYKVNSSGDVILRQEAVSVPKLRREANFLLDKGDELMLKGKSSEAKYSYNVASKLRIHADTLEGRGSSHWHDKSEKIS